MTGSAWGLKGPGAIMPKLVLYLPIVTTVSSLIFAVVLLRRYREKGRGPHLLWWAFGILIYGVGTFTESFTSVFGWNEAVFRAWYISGALLGGAPLAQGTVYLLLRRKTANRLTAALVSFFLVAASFVVVAPINTALVEPHRLSGKVLAWPCVRLFSPFINTYVNAPVGVNAMWDAQFQPLLSLLATPFEVFEREIRAQLGATLAGGGFDPAADITGITVNRWPHGYAPELNSLFEPQYAEADKPYVIGRAPFGRIAIANSDSGGGAYTSVAIEQGYRAVQEVLGG
jgi:hypothetical protein